MDHSFGADRPFQPLPPAFAAIGARIVTFLHGGGRTGVLIGPPGSGKTRVLDAIVAGMPGRVMRVSNRQPSVLTVARMLAQLGDAEGLAAADDGRALLAHLAPVSGEADAAVLVVDDAHTLSAGALSALARVPGLGGPDLPGMVVLLAGEDELLMRLGPLREPRTALVLAMEDGPGLVPTPPLDEAPTADAYGPGVQAAGAGARSGFHIVAMLAAVLAGAAAFGVGLWLASRPPERAPLPGVAAAPPVGVPQLRGTALAAADSASGQTMVAVATDSQLRREFEAFLDRSGDTAHLTPTARAALFRDYLVWRARTAPRKG